MLGVGENRVFRDGMIHVHAEKCHTCIFRPGNVMHLRPGRVKGMVEEARQNWSVIPCHETLGPEAAVCAGYAGLRPTPDCLQVAERMGFIEHVNPPAEP